MNPPPALALPAPLRGAIQHMKLAVRAAAERTVDSLGVTALASANLRQRDALLGAQFELSRKLAMFCTLFDEDLERRLQLELTPRGGGSTGVTRWDALSLVDNFEVERQVLAERLGTQLGQDCESEQREFDAFVGSVLQPPAGDGPRNPLRPDVIGHAVLGAVDGVADRKEQRQALAAELMRALAAAMPQTYAQIVADMRKAGVQPAQPSFRSSERGSGYGRSGPDTSSRAAGLDDGPMSSTRAGLPAGNTWAGSGHGPATGFGAAGPSSRMGPAGGPRTGAGALGSGMRHA
ncbi:MAG: DUF1631 family protein, partial [Burkholderiales bacterium]|nr:DUF1631 family protein [Burkholderiales bacterium]